MKKFGFFFTGLIMLSAVAVAQPSTKYNLVFDSLAKRWDEAMPLGNGWLGALVWQKENNLRLSLDRVDLWDDRPMPGIDQLRFDWVKEQVKKNEYDTVQKLSDEPYEKYPAPSKIPGAAIEFDLASLGKVTSNVLDIQTATNTIRFDDGVVFKNFVHATETAGYFSFENCNKLILPLIKIPPYVSNEKGGTGNSVEGQGLERLGYTKGKIITGKNFIRYHQPAWNGNYYEVLVQWTKHNNTITGRWTISWNQTASLPAINAAVAATAYKTHLAWWKNYWSRSAITVPDTLLAKQYYLEMYKFGCVARSNTPPIALQAIWTADNGNLPPWKGDFHHDLNTQLSYWPGYTGNHLDLTASYTNWLWKVKAESERWTKQYFGVEGLNVPGVTTISGKAMGGWIQYSFSLTTAAWLAQHFYWQWKYSMDQNFLQQRCAPYLTAVQKYASTIRVLDPVSNTWKLPLSSSPEYHDNSVKAWFNNTTNYDLSLLKSLQQEYMEVSKKANNFNASLIGKAAYPAYDVNETGLTIAPNQDLEESHRHLAQLMPIYPLADLDINKEADADIINKSLRWLEQKGTRQWCGYSFSWAACIYAKAKQADSAAKMLQIFAHNFVSTNSFHLNGDQRGGQYSDFTYRPFTLEGNFAFAQGIHEMLIQSNRGYIEVFPAIPSSWKDVSFKTLRTEGAFLVSAKRENGVVDEVKITATVDGWLHLKLPFKTFYLDKKEKRYTLHENILEIELKKGEIVVIKNGYE